MQYALALIFLLTMLLTLAIRDICLLYKTFPKKESLLSTDEYLKKYWRV